jgi:restriction system protein
MGRRRDDSLLQIAFTSAWPVATTFALLILAFIYIVAPFMAGNNPVLNAMTQGVKPIALIAAGFFGLIALVKWIMASPRPRKAANLAQRGQARAGTQPARPVPMQRPAEIRREPILFAESKPAQVSAPLGEWTIELIQSIEWKRFEDVCQKFYESKGIRSACTPLGPDGGIDIRLFQDDSGRASAIVQCKAWGSSYVGVKPIRELLGVMVHEKVEKSFFMTSCKYSDEAKAFAAPNRITLIDGALFLAMLKRLPAEARHKLFKFATAGDYNIPSCPTCGRKMRFITGKEGQRDFWGCPSFPRCQQQKLWARRGTTGLPAAVYE